MLAPTAPVMVPPQYDYGIFLCDVDPSSEQAAPRTAIQPGSMWPQALGGPGGGFLQLHVGEEKIVPYVESLPVQVCLMGKIGWLNRGRVCRPWNTSKVVGGNQRVWWGSLQLHVGDDSMPVQAFFFFWRACYV